MYDTQIFVHILRQWFTKTQKNKSLFVCAILIEMNYMCVCWACVCNLQKKTVVWMTAHPKWNDMQMSLSLALIVFVASLNLKETQRKVN